MLSFRKRKSSDTDRLGLPCPDHPVAVIGDVHGRADLLAKLARRIPQGFAWVFVGDLIDRGEQSALALRFVAETCQAEPNFVCILGNHERMMLDALEDPAGAGPLWLRYGGRQTLASFGLHSLPISPTPEQYLAEFDILRARLGEDVIHWLHGLPLIWTSGTLTVAHAAVDPSEPVEQQSEKTLLWGQRKFFQSARRDGMWVAHGHTIVEAPVFEKSRISVDTGAFHTGCLTAALIEPSGRVDFVQSV